MIITILFYVLANSKLTKYLSMITLNSPALPVFNMMPHTMPASFIPVVAAPNYLNVAFVAGSDNNNYGQISNVMPPTFIQLPPGLIQNFQLNLQNYPVFIPTPNQVPAAFVNPTIQENIPQYGFQSEDEQEFWALSTEVFRTVLDQASDKLSEKYDDSSIFKGKDVDLENWKALIKDLVEQNTTFEKSETGIIEKLLMDARNESRFAKHFEIITEQRATLNIGETEIKVEVVEIVQSDLVIAPTSQEECSPQNSEQANIAHEQKHDMELSKEINIVVSIQDSGDVSKNDSETSKILLNSNAAPNLDDVVQPETNAKKAKKASVSRTGKSSNKKKSERSSYEPEQVNSKENSHQEIANDSESSDLRFSKNNTLSTDDSFVRTTKCSRSDNEHDRSRKEMISEEEDHATCGSDRKLTERTEKFLFSNEKPEEQVEEISTRTNYNFAAKNSVFKEDGNYQLNIEKKTDLKIPTVDELESQVKAIYNSNKEFEGDMNPEFSNYVDVVLKGLCENNAKINNKQEDASNMESKKSKNQKNQKKKLKRKQTKAQRTKLVEDVCHPEAARNPNVNLSIVPPTQENEDEGVTEFSDNSTAQKENKYLLEMGFSLEELQEIEEINMELEKIMRRSNHAAYEKEQPLTIQITPKKSILQEGSCINDVLDAKNQFESFATMIDKDIQNSMPTENVGQTLEEDFRFSYKHELEMALDAMDLLEELINLKHKNNEPLSKLYFNCY